MKNFNEILIIDVEDLQFSDEVCDIIFTKVTNNEIKGSFANYDDRILFFLESSKDVVCDELEKITGDKKVIDQVKSLREATDYWFQQDEIDIKTGYGNIYISASTIDTIMVDELLNNQEIIDKLVDADDFIEELTNVRKEAMRIAFDLSCDTARMVLDKTIEKYYK